MQKSFDKSEGNGNGIEPFFPVTFNPSRRADFCVQRNTASCVLSISKRFRMLKTTCPAGAEKHLPKSGFCVNYKWICHERKQQKTIKKDRTPT